MRRVRAAAAGPAAVVLLWSTLPAASIHSGFPLLGPRPLSWLAADPASAALFQAGLAGAGLLLVVFHGHVRARYPVGPWFSVAMLTGLAGQMVAAVVPISGADLAHHVHTVAALTLGASLPVLMWLFADAQPAGAWRRRARHLAWAEVIASIAGLVLSRRSVAALAEVLPAAVFHVWVVVTAVSAGPGPRKPRLVTGREHTVPVRC
ncbi:MAG TPA: DUF998 domain-containing protein [Acidimicrobiales bacterium]|nr:DUF998 domain-containing protein [Acidimicrobiales bacterium]